MRELPNLLSRKARPFAVLLVLFQSGVAFVDGSTGSLSALSQQVWNPRNLPWLSDRRTQFASTYNTPEIPKIRATTVTTTVAQESTMTANFLLNDTRTEDEQTATEKTSQTNDTKVISTTASTLDLEGKTEIDEPQRLLSTMSLPNTTISPSTTAPSSTTSTAIPPATTSSPTTTTLNPECRKLTTDELYKKLEKVGGRNQRFMANSPEEAGQNFPGLLADPEDIHDAVAHPNYFSDAVPPRIFDPHFCDMECLDIKFRLNEALLNLDKDKVAVPLNDTGPPEVQEGKGKWKGACYLDKFISLGNCSQRGDEEVWGYEKLCSACHGIYLLSGNCFPQFFNSIVCNRQDARCIFDRFTTGAHGKCQARTLSFKVMRNVGTEECQDWVYEYLDVPIACECYLSKNSWLKA